MPDLTPHLSPGQVAQAMVSPRWTALLRSDVDLAGVRTWDPTLLRQSRVLVPIDVQALYVPPEASETYVRLPFVLTAPDGQPAEPMPAPFADGVPRPPGVHLHWALPDALLQGSLQDRTDQPNRLDLPPLPDRWVVLRLVAPAGALAPYVRGWVIEADTARVHDLSAWTGTPDPDAPQLGRTVAPADLNGTAGGSVLWTGGYDATAGRFALHDPLDDLPQNLPNGAVDDLAVYLVAGWWSDPAGDPLDGAQTTSSLHVRLAELGWALTTDAGGADAVDLDRDVTAARRSTFLSTADRYAVRANGAALTPQPHGGGVGPSAAAPTPIADQLAALAEPVQGYRPSVSVLADAAAAVVQAEPRWPRSTVLHGAVHGVPVAGPVVADGRPDPTALGLALGHHGDDVAATLFAAGLGADTWQERRDLGRVLTAFTSQLLASLGTPDGVVDVEESEHTAGFESLAAGDGGVDRVTLGATAGPFDAGRAARSAAARATAIPLSVELSWLGKDRTALLEPDRLRSVVHGWSPTDTGPGKAEIREVTRPAPRYFRPIDPQLALRGPRRSLRHQGDGRFSPDGRLLCRWPRDVPQGYAGLLDGARLLPSVSSGALPPEVVALAREALTQSPYLWQWLADVAAGQRGVDAGLAVARLRAEGLLRYGAGAVYDGASDAFLPQQPAAAGPAYAVTGTARQIADELRRFSLVDGVDVSPVAVTTWTQPWIPLWLEWEVEAVLADRFDGWTLGAVDLELPAGGATSPPGRMFTGRAPLHTGTATALAKSIEGWAKAEDALDRSNAGEADAGTTALLARLGDAIENLDVVTAGLDGLRDRLLGLPADDGVLRPRGDDGTLGCVAPVDDPQLVLAGTVRLTRARLVDAFGRTLDVPVELTALPARDEVDLPPDPDGPDPSPALRMRPRVLRPARWLFRLVDAGDLTLAAREATIDQADPTRMVNPVAGFLLPDHVDASIEVFDVAGRPLGQLLENAVGGGVAWEIAPGRAGPADAGPLHGLDGPQLPLGHLAAGMVAADAAARQGLPVAEQQPESALAAFLRAVDSTLWGVDTLAALGTEHIAGLVGRPIAVVRATLRIDIADDLDELDLSDPQRRAARQAAYAALADRAFPVRVGEITRADDGTLAFFVDDDFATVHLVDKVVRDGALQSGPWEGHLGPFGQSPVIPDEQPITHPYLVADDEVTVHPGQTVTLTILMNPSGAVNLTSGVLPRKSLALARDWVRPGLAVIAPSARIGPVLIDTKQVRLPLLSAFGRDQIWTRRDTPSSWKDDPILAATQTALLPDLPHTVEEGYIRIAPTTPTTPTTPATADGAVGGSGGTGNGATTSGGTT